MSWNGALRGAIEMGRVGIEKTADVYGDDVARATMSGTKPASPRSPRHGDAVEENKTD